jgi:hypothetical protein
MWIVGNLAAFFYGFGIWFFPTFVGSFVGALLLPQTGSGLTVTEFDGPIIMFAVFAAIQNVIATVYFWAWKETSFAVRVGYWFYVAVTVLCALFASYLIWFYYA